MATGADQYTIRRGLLDRLLADPMAVAKSARIVPAFTAGMPAGFKLYAIHPGSLFERVGLQNGDTLMTINGFDLASPDKSLEVYSLIREMNPLELAYTRHGERRTLDISILPLDSGAD